MEMLELNRLFGSAYAGRKVLVTGHTGFKGSWLSFWLQALGAEVAGLALDPDSDPAHWTALELKLARDFRIDLRDSAAVRGAVAEFAPEVVFHLAAQPLVRRGYRDPITTFETNVGGLVHLLEAVRSCATVRVVVNATTDKVYEPRLSSNGYREGNPLGGRDPYSASKACSELVSACYRHSFFEHGNRRQNPVMLATARAGNVIGGGDWGEDRLIPDLVRAASSGQPLKLRSPLATRPWQHVLEPLSGYLRAGQMLLLGDIPAGCWNFGPSVDATLTVGDIVSRLCQAWPEIEVKFDPGPHPHEAEWLSLDSTKAERDLGWRSVWNAETALSRTAAWYKTYAEASELRTFVDLAAYVTAAREADMPWAV